MTFSPSNAQKLIRLFLRTRPHAMLNVGMGVGKTAPVLHEISAMLNAMRISGALVLAPNRVANVVWPDEADRWESLRWMRVANLRTEEGRKAFLDASAHVYLVNYESIHVLCELVEQYRKFRGRTAPLPFSLVVFDEITKAKNHASRRIKQFTGSITHEDVRYRWGMTGTLIPNNELDLFAQYRLIDGGARLGSSITGFRQRFFEPVNQYDPFTTVLRSGAKEKIAELISDITLTLPSAEWLDIPQPFTEDIEIEFPRVLRKQYKTLEKELVLEMLGKPDITVPNLGSLVFKLLQFTSGSVYDQEKQVHHMHDLKLDALKDALKRSESPTLVARGFKFEQEKFRKAFPKAEFFDDHKTPLKQRDLVKRWNAGEIPVLFGHPAAVGHGLNLQHGGWEIIWHTLTYNRDDYDQMNARLARTGQTRPVRIRRLMINNSIDWSVDYSLRHKRDETNALFDVLKTLSCSQETNLSLL